MTLQSPVQRHGRQFGHRHSTAECVTWEPHVPRTQLRLRSLEQATIVQVSANGAQIRARTNTAVTRGSRISIGRGSDRGLVAVRRLEPASVASMSDYSVQFLWLDPRMEAFFDASISTDTPLDFEWR